MVKELKKKPLTGKDREKYIHGLRESEGRITWTVNKAKFGQNDIIAVMVLMLPFFDMGFRGFMV